MKTYKARTLLEHSEENLSLSSLYISCNEIEFEEFVQFVQFIENHFLEKLHVRGRFRFPDTSGSRIFAIRIDFNGIQKEGIVKKVFDFFFRIMAQSIP